MKKCSECYHHYTNEQCMEDGKEETGIEEGCFFCGAKNDEFLLIEDEEACEKFIEN